MSKAIQRMHGWSHLVMFVMLFLLALAVMKVNAPTGLAAGNQTITASGVTDLSPFLTAVGLLIGLFITVMIVMNARIGVQNKSPITKVHKKQSEDLSKINSELAKIRKKIGR